MTSGSRSLRSSFTLVDGAGAVIGKDEVDGPSSENAVI
jgi:hypothetical protein